jgi:hypothetical protein
LNGDLDAKLVSCLPGLKLESTDLPEEERQKIKDLLFILEKK